MKLFEVPGCNNSTNRGVGILGTSTDSFVNVTGEINKFGDNFKTQLQRKIQFWISGWATGQNMKFCHGYDQSEYNGKYAMCYQFEIGSHRLYGFLCNPLEGNNRFQLFVGVHVFEKHQWRTDETVLKKVAKLSENPAVISAIKDFTYGYGRST